jgi:Tol biopolymer transport system component
MTRIRRTLTVVCLLGLATAVSPALGAFPGENGKIAFFSDRQGGDFDIWTMDPDGGGLANLTAKSKADDLSAGWRADGRKLAFVSDRVTATNPEGDYEIFVMNPDGSQQRQITFNALDDEDPAWASEGTRIAFHRDFDPVRGQVDDDLFTMRSDGSGERNLTNSPGVMDIQPNWSPDGRRIVFVSDRDGDLDVYTMSPKGASVRQLTFNDAVEFHPNWSPDGESITFATDRDGDFEVYTMRANGADQMNVTANPARDEGVSAWSPDGEKIAFVCCHAGGQTDIFTMDADGANQANLTPSPAFDFEPDWQPLVDDFRRLRR